jgi:4-amino-4-deoxy-L-arabinose transferase-like glycosyltransferase
MNRWIDRLACIILPQPSTATAGVHRLAVGIDENGWSPRTRTHCWIGWGIRFPKNDGLWLYAVLGLAAFTNTTGLFATILDGDSAAYAIIAKTMVQHHDFVNLFLDGNDWLDKPHLSFWLTAISFEIFGFSTWAYKLPGVILVLAAAFYTYVFAKILYNKSVAVVAAIILLTAQHIIISSSDVRMEAYLTAFIIGAVYHFYQASRLRSNAHLVAGSLLAAAAVMTKGPFVLLPIGGAISGGLLLSRQWMQVFHVRWIAATLLILLFISPELFCLWQQFDAHPEKSVFGRTGVSGLRFFLLDGQFGRFFNADAYGHVSGDPFRYLHVVLWAFLPWSIPLYAATYYAIRKLILHQPQTIDYFTLSGGLLTFLLFSLSQFHYDHYLTIAFPFFAIITSAHILSLTTPTEVRWATVWQWLFVGIALAVCVTLQLLVRPEHWAGPAALFVTVALLLLYLHKKPWEQWQARLIATMATTSIFANLYLNFYTVPVLMRYQAGSEMAFYLNKHYPGQPVIKASNDYSFTLEFYLQAPVTTVDVRSLQEDRLPQGALVYASASELRPLSDKFELLHRTASYSVSHPRPNFLNAATREGVLGEFWLVRTRGVSPAGAPASQ